MRPLAALLVALALAACGETPESATYGSTGVTIEIKIADGKVSPRNEFVDVKIGEPVNLHVVSDADERLHVHSYPQHKFDIAAGGDETFTFTIDDPDQVSVDAHVLGVTVVQLVPTY